MPAGVLGVILELGKAPSQRSRVGSLAGSARHQASHRRLSGRSFRKLRPVHSAAMAAPGGLVREGFSQRREPNPLETVRAVDPAFPKTTASMLGYFGMAARLDTEVVTVRVRGCAPGLCVMTMSEAAPMGICCYIGWVGPADFIDYWSRILAVMEFVPLSSLAPYGAKYLFREITRLYAGIPT